MAILFVAAKQLLKFLKAFENNSQTWKPNFQNLRKHSGPGNTERLCGLPLNFTSLENKKKQLHVPGQPFRTLVFILNLATIQPGLKKPALRPFRKDTSFDISVTSLHSKKARGPLRAFLYIPMLSHRNYCTKETAAKLLHFAQILTGEYKPSLVQH